MAWRIAAWAGLILPLLVHPASAAGNAVDLELVVSVDVSLPMDRDEQVVARNGYVDAFRTPELIDAIVHGGLGRIAVTYVEFSDKQTIVVPWMVIDGAASANAFADRLAAAPLQEIGGTSISGDIAFTSGLFDASGYASPRRTIDVSGNGPNNTGAPVTAARDAAAAVGITINGLPIDLGVREAVIPDLADYYKDCVLGGPEAFMIAIHSDAEMPAAIRRKLVEEISQDQTRERPRVVPVDDPASPATDCMVGEKLGPYVPRFRFGGSFE